MESVNDEPLSSESLTSVTNLSRSTVVHELRRAGVSYSTLPYCNIGKLGCNLLHLLTYRFMSLLVG